MLKLPILFTFESEAIRAILIEDKGYTRFVCFKFISLTVRVLSKIRNSFISKDAFALVH